MRPLFGERYRSRRSREVYSGLGLASGTGYGGIGRPSVGLAERARRYSRYAPRGREWFGAETLSARYSNPDGGKVSRFANEVLKPAGWGALGLVGARAIGELYGWVGSKVGISKVPGGAQPYMPIGLAALSAGTTWYLAGTKFAAKLTPEKRRYVNVGAGLLVVQELLALLLPKLGFLPSWAKRSLTGELPPALAGLPAIQQQQAALGNCFTGTCASALAPYGWQAPPCGLPPGEAAAWQAAQAIASSGRPLQGDEGMGNCFTGQCPGNPPGCTGSGPQCCGCPPQFPPPGLHTEPPQFPPPGGGGGGGGGGGPVPPSTVIPPSTGYRGGATASPVPPASGWGMAGQIAVQRSGIQDPIIQQILAGSCAKAETLFSQVGLA